MSMPLQITIKESASELKALLSKHTVSKQKRIQMLLLIQKGNHATKESLMHSLSVSSQSIQTWRTNYKKGGLDLLLADKRKSTKKAAIKPPIKAKLEKRLSSSKAGFKSFVEVQQWLEEKCGVKMSYHAVNKYMKRHFAVKLKVARKSHIHKNAADEAVFKKPSQKVETY